jgi:F0F1-type ATP synthase assembly protein I
VRVRFMVNRVQWRVYKFLVTLHVLAAVLVMGPFVLAAFAGNRAIRRRNVAETRDAATFMARFGIGTLLVAVLGIGALSLSDRYSFRTPWVIISLTLYVVVMGLATGYTVPAMRRAAHLMEQGAASQPAGEVDETSPPAASATATDLATKERLDYVAGRVVGSGALVLLIVVLITILMVTRPFGK